MYNDANEDDISEFLNTAKSLLYLDKSFVLIPRRVNMKSLAKIGLNVDSAKDVIGNLNCDDYFCGPEKDIDKSYGGYVWVFKKKYNNKLLYIKLKIDNCDTGNVLKCLSFHIDR